jgi:hypothetical protein
MAVIEHVLHQVQVSLHAETRLFYFAVVATL